MSVIEKTASVDQVIAFLELSEDIPLYLDGGWGVDALLGKQTRSHCDLDIIVGIDASNALISLLLEHAYQRQSETELVFIAPSGLSLDVHCVRFDERGYGIFDLPDGRMWPMPPAAFSGEGVVGGRTVRCLSPEAQVQCHGQGYEPTAKDINDMMALQVKFGVVLPLSLCRQD